MASSWGVVVLRALEIAEKEGKMSKHAVDVEVARPYSFDLESGLLQWSIGWARQSLIQMISDQQITLPPS